MTKQCPTCGASMARETMAGTDSRGVAQFQCQETCNECDTTVTEFGEVITKEEKARRAAEWGCGR